MSHPAKISRNNLERPAKRPKVKIRIVGRLAELDRVPFALPAEVLAREVRRYEAGSPRGIKAVTDFPPISITAPGGQLVILSGFVTRVVAFLERRGVDVKVVDRTSPRRRVAIVEAGMRGLPPEGEEFARLVAGRRRVQVDIRGEHRRIALIAAVARAMPEARIAVTTASRAQAAAIRDQLQARLGEGVALFHKHGRVLCEARVQVCTFGSLDEDNSDVIVFFEAGDVTTSNYLQSFGVFGHRHVVAFSDPDARVGEPERLLREGLLGPAIDLACDPSGRRAEVRVVHARCPQVTRPAGLGGLELKRQSTWLNGPRNRAIAEIAKAFATDRREVLQGYGLVSDGTIARKSPGTDEDDRRVAVLVESPEHGRALRQLLKGWRLIDDRSKDDGTGHDVGGQAQDLPPRTILTHVRAARMADLDVDVLIRADANEWSPDLPGFPPLDGDGGGRTVMLVHLGDEGEEGGTGAARRRGEGDKDRDRDVGGSSRRARRS